MFGISVKADSRVASINQLYAASGGGAQFLAASKRAFCSCGDIRRGSIASFSIRGMSPPSFSISPTAALQKLTIAVSSAVKASSAIAKQRFSASSATSEVPSIIRETERNFQPAPASSQHSSQTPCRLNKTASSMRACISVEVRPSSSSTLRAPRSIFPSALSRPASNRRSTVRFSNSFVSSPLTTLSNSAAKLSNVERMPVFVSSICLLRRCSTMRDHACGTNRVTSPPIASRRFIGRPSPVSQIP